MLAEGVQPAVVRAEVSGHHCTCPRAPALRSYGVLRAADKHMCSVSRQENKAMTGRREMWEAVLGQGSILRISVEI